MEYILVIVLVLGAVMILLRPFLGDLRTKIEESVTQGVFHKDNNFYYYPVKR